jgi:tetratricopeptide (TPR) repeat protein
MPPKTYMVVDPRHDHSFRIPRPDLSVKLGTPNACNNCHDKESALWAATKMEEWYGKQPVGHQIFASAVHAMRKQLPAAFELSQPLIADSEQPAIVRATLLGLSGQAAHPGVMAALREAVKDEDPMVRVSALLAMESMEPLSRVQLAFPLLEDDARVVRMHAARLLAAIPAGDLPARQKSLLDAGIQEYVDAQLFNTERPESQVNLGGIYADLGRIDEANSAYQKALQLQPKFAPAYINQSQLLNRQNRLDEAISLLEKGIGQVPDNAALHHALGLALVRKKQVQRALDHLSRAAEIDPDVARYGYVYAIGLQSTGDINAAILELEQTHGRHPGDTDVLLALVTINRDAGNTSSALRYLRKLKKMYPENAGLLQMEQQLTR